MLPLMQILNQYDHEYHFWLDRAYRPRGDKSSELRERRVQEWCDYLDKLGMDVIIVPPMCELAASNYQLSASVLPLFETYILEYALKYSIVGKLWLLCDQADMEWAQQVISEMASKYTPTDNQKNIKKFHTPFAMWKKNLRMWTYFITTYGRRDSMVRKTLKYDLRYFSDADVDTLIPMSRGHLFFQKIIKTRINRKKKRFHWLDAVKECFERIIGDKWQVAGGKYSMTLHCTDMPTPILAEQKWMSVLGRGGEVEVKIEEI